MTYNEAIEKINNTRSWDYKNSEVEMELLANIVTEGMKEKFRAGESLSTQEQSVLLDWEIFPYEWGDIVEVLRHGYIVREYIFEVDEDENYMLTFEWHEDYGIQIVDYETPARCYYKDVVVKKWVCEEENEDNAGNS